MKRAYLILIVLAAALTTACTSQQAKTDTPEGVPAAKAAPAKEITKKEVVKKEAVKKETVIEEEAAGVPASGSKFSRLKLGITLGQVEKLIGPPTRQWQHPTDKASIPFYFGPDRWVIQYAYRHEGVLTFNSGGEQLLTRIEVNRAE